MNYYPDQYAEDEREQVGWALNAVPLVKINFQLIDERETRELRERIRRSRERETR